MADFLQKPPVKIVVACYKSKYHTFKNWFRNAMFSSCDVDYHELEKADERGDEVMVRRYLAPGSFFVGVVDPNDPFCCGIAKALLDMCTRYNVSSTTLYFGHTGDESRPPFPHIEAFYLKFKKVYRNFWWNVEPFMSLREKGLLGWFPLGPLVTGNNSIAFIPSSQRTQMLYFVGGKTTNKRRPGNLGYLQKVLNETLTGGIKTSRSYGNDLRNSVFCPNIRGTSAECFRFYEAMEHGCIPLMLDNYPDFHYGEQHRHQFSILLELTRNKKYTPFIWSENSTALRAQFDSLVRSGSDGLATLDLLQRDMMEWYANVKSYFDGEFSKEMCLK